MEEKKVVASYTVTRYEDGSVDVKNVEVEGATEMPTEDIYRDIEEVAKMIATKRVENAAFVGAYNGTAKFYQDVNTAKAAEQEAPTEE